MSEKFVFLHIPKNGGTSLRELMASWFPPERSCPYRTGEDYTANFSEADLEAYDYFTGHVPAGVAQRYFADDIPKLTVLRNPVDRIYSLYAYWRTYEIPETNILEQRTKGEIPTLYAAELQGPYMAQQHSFGSFLFSDNAYIQRVLTNPQARFLCDGKLTNKIGAMDPDEALAAILNTIDRMNITVTTLEGSQHLNDTLSTFATRFGVEGDTEIPHSNKSERVFFDGLDPGRIESYLRLVAPLDFLLYDHFHRPDAVNS